MSIDHILSLSTLHTAAPGILDVVFGPDGDFEGAPLWAGPCLRADGQYVAVHFESVTPDAAWRLERLSLDLRIPAVAARVAGLCARVVEGDRVIYPCGDSPVTAREFLAAALQAPVTGECGPSLAADLAALALALAPRIAALGGSNG